MITLYSVLGKCVTHLLISETRRTECCCNEANKGASEPNTALYVFACPFECDFFLFHADNTDNTHTLATAGLPSVMRMGRT